MVPKWLRNILNGVVRFVFANEIHGMQRHKGTYCYRRNRRVD